ncbi:MAG: cyclic nucleotide-binding domain-containing protein [Alphaproteobacteria bacterium]|nr:cyclic nucleotide-binding domain-containing protein [Alphaproteobacteria bacterium]
MSLSQEVELLKKIPLFANIETSKLKLLAFTSERMSFRGGDVLFEEGEVGTAAFIIMEGEAEVMINTANGPRVIARVGTNDVVGEIAILCDVPRTATVRAVSPLTTLVITKDLFFRLVTEFPQMAVEIMRVLAQRLDRTNKALALAKEGGERGGGG